MKSPLLFLLLLLAFSFGTALAQQPAADTAKARRDSIGSATIMRLDQTSGREPRRDTMRAGSYNFRQKTQIIRKNGKDSVVVVETQSSFQPDPNAPAAQKAVNNPPVKVPGNFDPNTQQKQELVDKIDLAIKDLDDEIGMIDDNRSSGTKAPREAFKARRARLAGYKSKLNDVTASLKNSNAAEFAGARAKAVSVMREAQAALISGNRK